MPVALDARSAMEQIQTLKRLGDAPSFTGQPSSAVCTPSSSWCAQWQTQLDNSLAAGGLGREGPSQPNSVRREGPQASRPLCLEHGRRPLQVGASLHARSLRPPHLLSSLVISCQLLSSIVRSMLETARTALWPAFQHKLIVTLTQALPSVPTSVLELVAAYR
jgi:hypothetical protein